jgi:hypothetical protein
MDGAAKELDAVGMFQTLTENPNRCGAVSNALPLKPACKKLQPIDPP